MEKMLQVKTYNIFKVVVKGYHECSFTVSVGEKYMYVVRRKRGDQGSAQIQSKSARAFTMRRLSSIDSIKFGNRTHRKVPVRLCSIAEPIEKQSNDWSLIEFN